MLKLSHPSGWSIWCILFIVYNTPRGRKIPFPGTHRQHGQHWRYKLRPRRGLNSRVSKYLWHNIRDIPGPSPGERGLVCPPKIDAFLYMILQYTVNLCRCGFGSCLEFWGVAEGVYYPGGNAPPYPLIPKCEIPRIRKVSLHYKY